MSIKLLDEKKVYYKGEFLDPNSFKGLPSREKTIAYKILEKHNKSENIEELKIKFDALASHDITYVGIIQSARASGLEKFPVPYVLTNCHNSLCCVGGTINEDDHLFGLSCAKKYGGIYVPANQAVIHTYMRENFAAPGKMILGSDSHTRYGAIGTMAIGEGGPELVKQILNRTYDIAYPNIIAVKLTGKVRRGVGPQDIALLLIGEVFKNAFVKNAVLEFVGDGIKHLSMEFRNGIDVMTTETACLSSIWETDDNTREYLKVFGRENEFVKLKAEDGALYDKVIEIDLSKAEPMIAMPFHPSNTYKLQDVIDNPKEILSKVEEEGNKLLGFKNHEFKLTDKIVDGKVKVSQAVIAGCAGGTYDNIMVASEIIKDKTIGSDAFSFMIYPGSQPVNLQLIKNGAYDALIKAGAIIKPAFCGPCFGAGDVPNNNGFSIRHTTRNFERREGSKTDGQIASVALMDARSIAATAANGGVLTSALDMEYNEHFKLFRFETEIYKNRIYNGFGKPLPNEKIVFGPNITDIPKLEELKNNLAIKVVSVINDPVTTTDELIPSGETSSYRSNPLKLAEFALSRKDPGYLTRAKEVRDGSNMDILTAIEKERLDKNDVSIGSTIYARKVGDGSAREQAASCQRFLSASANLAKEYATKRYRSNVINWGMVPFRTEDQFELNDILIVKNIRKIIENNDNVVDAILYRDKEKLNIKLTIDRLTKEERDIILSGCLINYYRQNR